MKLATHTENAQVIQYSTFCRPITPVYSGFNAKMNDELASILQKEIKAAGSKGFEGLIAKLLEKLTGYHFLLAKSGSQEGRDLSSRSEKANVIAVECKRYKAQTALDEREL
jgi:hypothetical protein